jgi:uncharacterized membrane protein (DUF485 family)
MASNAFKEIKLGFMVGVGLFVFSFVLMIFMALAARATAKG